MDREIVKEESMYDFYREQTLLLTEEYKKLNQRIDKAVEYINKVKILNEEDKEDLMKWEYETFFPNLLNILKGEDKE